MQPLCHLCRQAVYYDNAFVFINKNAMMFFMFSIFQFIVNVLENIFQSYFSALMMPMLLFFKKI